MLEKKQEKSVNQKMWINKTLLDTLIKNYGSFFQHLLDLALKNKNEQISSIFLIGSITNKHYHPITSDIDMIVVSDNPQQVLNSIETIIKHNNLASSLILKYSNKLIFYLKPIATKKNTEMYGKKVDLFVVNNPLEISDYLYVSLSKTENPQDTILFDNAFPNLLGLLEKMKQRIDEDYTIPLINYYITRFIEAFDNGSKAHYKSDSYQTYFQFHIAYHSLVSLFHFINKREASELYLPKYFFNSKMDKKEINDWHSLASTYVFTAGMNNVNKLKKKYIQMFSKLLDLLNLKDVGYDKDEILSFLWGTYKKYRLWNFRDITTFTLKIKKRIIFRSSALPRYLDDKEIKEVLTSTDIKTIIDIRSHKEKNEFPYNLSTLQKLSVNYLHIPIDPYKECEEEIKDPPTGLLPEEQFYTFFPLRYGKEIVTILKSTIEAKKPVLIHCVAGKDRTGLIIAIIMKLLGIEEKNIEKEFLLSYEPPKLENLKLTFKTIEKRYGSVKSYLFANDFLQEDYLRLRMILLNETVAINDF